MDVILAKNLTAGTSVQFIEASATNPVSFQVDGALAANVITFTLLGINGTDETAMYDAAGAVLVLSATIPLLSFDRPCRVLISKPITTNIVGLMKL
jgi:hypothetical protein